MDRTEIAEAYGETYDTQELQEHFKVTSFLAPYVLVERKEDGVRGTLMFQHAPRVYYNFQPD